MKAERAAKFHEGYEKAKTWKDAEELIQNELTPQERTELHEALNTVKAYMGLDMRQDFYNAILRHSNV